MAPVKALVKGRPKKTVQTKAFGQRLRAIRKKLNLTAEHVAHMTEVTPSTLSRYENGERMPSFEVLARLKAFFGVSYDELLDGTTLAA